MKILLSNDDGYDSPAIHLLFERLSAEHQVVMVAPDRERSGSSHGITLRKTVQFTQVEPHKYQCDGTPADCVLYALLGGVEMQPDCVIGGINLGANLGSDILYSGTAAVAREGAIYNLPAAAVSSLNHHPTQGHDIEAKCLLNRLPELLSQAPPRSFININFPETVSETTPWRQTRPAMRRYSDRIEISTDSSHPHIRRYWLRGEPVGHAADQPDSDWYWVQRQTVVYSFIPVDR